MFTSKAIALSYKAGRAVIRILYKTQPSSNQHGISLNVTEDILFSFGVFRKDMEKTLYSMVCFNMQIEFIKSKDKHDTQ